MYYYFICINLLISLSSPFFNGWGPGSQQKLPIIWLHLNIQTSDKLKGRNLNKWVENHNNYRCFLTGQEGSLNDPRNTHATWPDSNCRKRNWEWNCCLSCYPHLSFLPSCTFVGHIATFCMLLFCLLSSHVCDILSCKENKKTTRLNQLAVVGHKMVKLVTFNDVKNPAYMQFQLPKLLKWKLSKKSKTHTHTKTHAHLRLPTWARVSGRACSGGVLCPLSSWASVCSCWQSLQDPLH